MAMTSVAAGTVMVDGITMKRTPATATDAAAAPLPGAASTGSAEDDTNPHPMKKARHQHQLGDCDGGTDGTSTDTVADAGTANPDAGGGAVEKGKAELIKL